ncbi:MAG: NADH-quinone oxidoreductase subunit C [Ornithinimicrobium sp.]
MSGSELERGVQHIAVELSDWLSEIEASRGAGYDFFDWLSAVDHTGARGDGTTEPDPAGETNGEAVEGVAVEGVAAEAGPARGMQIVVHLMASAEQDRIPAPLPRLLMSTTVPPGGSIASVTSVFAGAAWHERETHEMFGVEFTGFDDGTPAGLRPLLLPEGFEGTPLAKSFLLAARASKPWPGAKEPGESDGDVVGKATEKADTAEAGASAAETPARRPRKRRRTLPPGVPDPSWGPRTQ